jgi:UDP-glucose 4-epimerase
MKILVTGGSGFIGQFLVKDLAKDSNNEVIIFDPQRPDYDLPENVFYVDGDICYKTLLDKHIIGCEEVYDCAGVLGTHELVFATGRAIDTNIKGAFNVLQACLDHGVKRLFHPTKPCFANYYENTYTISKIAAENFSRMYRKVYGMDITILRWMNASGPGQHLYPVRKFIPIAICLALLNKNIELYGTGEQTMDIIDVRDLSAIVIGSVRKGLGKTEHVWDVGTGQPISCKDVAEYIIKKIGSSSKIDYVPMRVGEAPMSNIYAKTHEELFEFIDYKLQYDPYQTLDDCIDYYKNLDPKILEATYQFFLKKAPDVSNPYQNEAGIKK